MHGLNTLILRSMSESRETAVAGGAGVGAAPARGDCAGFRDVACALAFAT